MSSIQKMSLNEYEVALRDPEFKDIEVLGEMFRDDVISRALAEKEAKSRAAAKLLPVLKWAHIVLDQAYGNSITIHPRTSFDRFQVPNWDALNKDRI